MNDHFRDYRKIDPTRGATLDDGSPNDNNRVEIGPTQLAFREWEDAGLQPPNLERMRAYRWKRLTQHIVDRGYGGLLMFDPLNIRYATDSTNMQLWNTHNPFRAVLLCADGYMVIWDYKNSPFLSEFNPLVREQRSGADLFYFDRGDKIDVAADVFSNEVRVLMEEHAGGNKRLAVDKIMLHGLRALEAQGFEIMEGEEVTEKSRSIKGPDEILAMRCASVACENAVAEMERITRRDVPLGNMSEDAIWAVLHAENIKRGGEWIETRLWPRVRAQTRGFRNAVRALCRTMKSSPLIRIWWGPTAFAWISAARGGLAIRRRAPIWYMRCNTPMNTS